MILTESKAAQVACAKKLSNIFSSGKIIKFEHLAQRWLIHICWNGFEL